MLPLAALAQSQHWVQVEAHPTLRTAEEWAARYEQQFGNVAGFRVPGGWYALALGPFETEADAGAVRLQLLADRMIPRDAYLTQDSDYGQQFWPAGAQAARSELQALPEPQEEVLTDSDTPAIVAPEPPVVVEEPEETLAQARANEARLTRDDRLAIQTALQYFGHYTLAIDAAFGPGTRRAVGDWQEAEGFEPTGFLTTRQRNQLLQGHAAELARLGLETWRDEEAGVEITLPLGMVAFDRHESPFAHFEEINDSGMRVLLISQEGTQATLFGLYEIMQTLAVIPLEGERARRSNGFLLTGRNANARAHVEAGYQGGQIKGWALLWEPGADDDAERVLPAMRESFRSFGGALPDNLGASASTVARRDLLAGLDVRRPLRSRSGFFVDARGTVATTAEAVEGCGSVTIDTAYRADVTLLDADNGIAILTPAEPLVPLAYAQFAPNGTRLDAEVRVSGFSYADTLTRPILTRGQVADLKGLNDEPMLHRLSIKVQEGDSGGPVFDSSGAVVGMLLPRTEDPDRTLPEEVNFSVSAQAMIDALDRAGRRGALSRENGAMPPETLTRVSADLTVLVSCWE
nr:trypsin-like peptidase domain-containing protein [Pararhodobacter sp. SW119]